MPESTAPRRRWFQFSLGTMLSVMAVAALALSLGQQMKLVADRRAFIAYLRDASHIVETVPNDPEATERLRKNWRPGIAIPRIPFWRQWMGDEALVFVFSEIDFSSDEARFKALFPEGTVIDAHAEAERRAQGTDTSPPKWTVNYSH
jgi:hypothetical protein